MSARTRKRAKRAKRDQRRRTRAARKPKTSPPSLRLSNAQQLRKLQKWLLPNDGIFAGLPLHGNTNWTPAALVWLALCWALVESKNVTDAFMLAVSPCRVLGPTPLETYQGLMNALVPWTDHLLSVLWPVLHRCMAQIGGAFWEIGGWIPMAFDGSRSTAPRTESNEKELCAPNYGKGKTAKYRKKKTKGLRRRKNEKAKPQPQEPQAWITLLWHMGLRLPWMWRLGPSNSSERAHVMDMLSVGHFLKNTLFYGDAGFIGYAFWAHILSCGYHFLIRVGGNVSLLTEWTDYTIGEDGLVLCWPKAAMQAGQPPLRLRLVRIKIGHTWVWILTSVLDPSKLTNVQIVHFYKMRWGIEVEFRGLKQTLDRGKLRCRNSRRLMVELHWSIMAMAVAELFALKEQLAPRRSKSDSTDPPPDPKKRSLANTVRALRCCLNTLRDTPPTRHRPPDAAAPGRHRQLRSQVLQASPLPSAESRQETLGRPQSSPAHRARTEQARCTSSQKHHLKILHGVAQPGRKNRMKAGSGIRLGHAVLFLLPPSSAPLSSLPGLSRETAPSAPR